MSGRKDEGATARVRRERVLEAHQRAEDEALGARVAWERATRAALGMVAGAPQQTELWGEAERRWERLVEADVRHDAAAKAEQEARGGRIWLN